MRTAATVGLDVVGIDIVCADIGAPLKQQGGAIVALTAMPDVRMHEHPTVGMARDAGDAIVDSLAEGDSIQAALAAQADVPPPPGSVMAHRALIEACFSESDVTGILARLDAVAAGEAGSSEAAFAADTALSLNAQSRSSL